MSELTCSTPGCDSSPAARGLCSKHYMRQRRSGSLTYPGFDPPLPRPGERWRPVVGYVGLYEVSDLGNVRSVDRVVTCRDGSVRCFRGKELAPGFASEGRPSVGLFSEGVQHTNRVCRLVLLAFVGPCPEGQEACHDPDPNPMNCRLLNLRWDTRSENRLDRVRHETDPHRNRTHDKWGHLLAKPNLVAYHAALGRRGCLACARARGNRQTAVKNLRPFDFGTVADRHYRLIMNQRD